MPGAGHARLSPQWRPGVVEGAQRGGRGPRRARGAGRAPLVHPELLRAAAAAEFEAAATAFFGSAEYAYRNRDNVQSMQDLYLVTMRRYATLYEIWSCANAINNGQATRAGVLHLFASSLEFNHRTAAVTQAGCLR